MSNAGRQNPSPGVIYDPNQPTIVFLTVHASERSPWLTNEVVHHSLIEAWKQADAWSVGYYLLMPDHIHLFCAPAKTGHSIEQWITYWKRCFRRLYGPSENTFQSRGWHHRLRNSESYLEKWNYVRLNPVRAGLIENADEWPWQGTIHELQWRQ